MPSYAVRCRARKRTQCSIPNTFWCPANPHRAELPLRVKPSPCQWRPELIPQLDALRRLYAFQCPLWAKSEHSRAGVVAQCQGLRYMDIFCERSGGPATTEKGMVPLCLPAHDCRQQGHCPVEPAGFILSDIHIDLGRQIAVPAAYRESDHRLAATGGDVAAHDRDDATVAMATGLWAPNLNAA